MFNAASAASWDARSEVAGRYRMKPTVCRGEDVWSYEQLLSRIAEMRCRLSAEVAHGPVLFAPRTTAHVCKDSIAIANQWKYRLGCYLEVRFQDILADPKPQIAGLFEFCELPPIRDDNVKFWHKINEVGHTHHKNKYADFDAFTSICREEMQALGYF
jgi:hypothetical protein